MRTFLFFKIFFKKVLSENFGSWPPLKFWSHDAPGPSKHSKLCTLPLTHDSENRDQRVPFLTYTAFTGQCFSIECDLHGKHVGMKHDSIEHEPTVAR